MLPEPIITRRWVPDVVLALGAKPLRFNRLLEIPGISDRLLSRRLRELEDTGLVVRIVHPGPPIKVEYSLTYAGERFLPAFRSLKEAEAALAS